MKKTVIHNQAENSLGPFRSVTANLQFEKRDGTMSRPVTRVSFERGDSVAAMLYKPESQKIPENPQENGGGLDSEDEDIEIIEVSLEEARIMMDEGQIVDAKTVIALQWFSQLQPIVLV